MLHQFKYSFAAYGTWLAANESHTFPDALPEISTSSGARLVRCESPAIRKYLYRPTSFPLPCRALGPVPMPIHPVIRPYTTYKNARDLSYSEVACVTILTWDVLITLSDEIELVWRRAWTTAKVTYLFARYLPWLVQLALLAINVNGTTGLEFTPTQCAAWQVVQGVLLQVIVSTVDVILVILYALYSRNHLLLAFLGSLFIAEIISLSYILAVVTPLLTYNDECYVTSSPPIFQYFWIISLTFETVLFALTIAKFFDAVRQGWGKGPIMRRFVTDGTWAYALIFLVMLVNMMLYKYVHTTLTGVCFTWLLVVLSFSGSRLVLNPRRAAAASQHNTCLHSDFELSRLSIIRSSSTSPSYAADFRPGIMVTIERTTDVLADHYEAEKEPVGYPCPTLGCSDGDVV